jgi:hypothetical protein
VTIEILQFYVVTGRESDVSDIVANTLGGVLGVALADVRGTLLAPSPATAAQLAAAAALVAAVGEAAAQVVLAVSLPHSIYYEQVAPDLGHLAVFDGVVLDASFNGQPFHVGRLSADSSAAMRAELLSGHARLSARILPGTPPPHLAPIVSVFDHRRREIFLLGRRRDDLVFRVRRRSDDLGFHPPSLVLPHALPAHDGRPDTVTIGAAVAAGATTIDVASHAIRAQRRIDTGVWQAWRLLVPDDTWYGDLSAPLTVVWVAAMFAPLGYWGGRAAAGEGIVSAVTPAIIALIASLAIIPWAANAPVAPWPVWAIAGAAVVLAWAFSVWIEA